MGAAPVQYTSTEILKKLEELPTLPSIVYELTAIINNPMSSTKEVENIMQNDVSLTTRVLKLANSAYYAIPGGVSSLGRAIAYIGFDTVNQLVLSASIIDALDLKKPSDFDVNEFWKHSIGVGIASETIAKHVRHPMPADLFTAGLVHDMGKIALCAYNVEFVTTIAKHAQEANLSFFEMEGQFELIRHTEIGRLLAEKWRLPVHMIHAIKYHHEKDTNLRTNLSADMNRNVDIVVLANLLVHALKFGNSGHKKILGAPTDVMGRLSLNPNEEFAALLKLIKSNLDKAQEFIRHLLGGKEMPTALGLSPENFYLIAEHTLTGLLLFETQTLECKYLNQMSRDILGVGSDSQPNFKLTQLMPDRSTQSGKFKPFASELIAYEGLFQDILVKKLNDQMFIASIGVKNLKFGETQYLLLMLQDMTVQVKLQREVEAKQDQIKTAYEELLQQNQQLKELDVAKTKFIALVTHELRTPISAISASSEMLKLKLYDNETQRFEFEGMIHQEAQHLLELVNDILDFAKIQAGKMDYYVGQHNLHDVVKHEIDVLQSMAEQCKIQVLLKDSPFDSSCYFDNMRVKQVIANIVNNAIKYNNPNGRVEVWLENKDKTIEVHVKDTGKGIAQEDQKKVFNEFETLGKISSHTKGTGLGMPITKRLLEGMGGSIALTSEVGVGSTFWISLPKEKVLEEIHYRERQDFGSEDLAA